MIRFFLFFLLATTLFGSKVETFRWSDGESYLMFLERHHLPVKPLYYNLDKDDQILTQEMRAGINYQILRDDDKNIKQMLLPLNDEPYHEHFHIFDEEKAVSLVDAAGFKVKSVQIRNRGLFYKDGREFQEIMIVGELNG